MRIIIDIDEDIYTDSNLKLLPKKKKNKFAYVCCNGAKKLDILTLLLFSKLTSRF